MSSGLRTTFIYTSRFLEFDYEPGHPLRSERLGLPYDLISACDLPFLFSCRDIEPKPVTNEEPLVFLKPDDLKVLKASDASYPFLKAFQYGLGASDNPILPGTCRRLAPDVSSFGFKVADSGCSKLKIWNSKRRPGRVPGRRRGKR